MQDSATTDYEEYPWYRRIELYDLPSKKELHVSLHVNVPLLVMGIVLIIYLWFEKKYR